MRHIESVQILRAFAALAIAIHHGIYDMAAVAASTGASFAPPRLLPWPAGVDLFFVISGFVMVYASRRLFGSWSAPGHFLARRAARIVPLYWAATVLVLLAAIVLPNAISGPMPTALTALASFAFIPIPRPDGVLQPVYSLGWTLNYEMFFYVVFALFLPLRRRFAVVAVGVVLIVFCVWGQTTGPNVVLRFWSAPMILLFVAGMAVATARIEGLALPDWLRLAMIIAALALLALDPPGFMQDPLAIGQPLDVTRVAAWGVPATLLVAAAALGTADAPAKPLAPAAWAGLVALGEASYALYLVHPFVYKLLREALLRSGVAAAIGPWPYLALIVMAALAASLLVHRLAERPVTAYLQAKLA